MPAEIQTKLLQIDKELGYITISTLNNIIPEDKTADFIDEIYAFLEKNKIIGAPEPARIVLKHENLQRVRSISYTGPKKNYGL